MIVNDKKVDIIKTPKNIDHIKKMADNLYKAKLLVISKADNSTYLDIDVNKVASSVKTGNFQLNQKVAEGSLLKGIITGLPTQKAGRSFDLEIPVMYKNEFLEVEGILQQLNKYYSLAANSNNYRFYLCYEFQKDLYKAELILTGISGYNLKDVLNVGNVKLSFSQLDNFFYRDSYDEIRFTDLEGDPGEGGRKEATINIDTYAPTIAYLDIKFDSIKTEGEFKNGQQHVLFCFGSASSLGLYIKRFREVDVSNSPTDTVDGYNLITKDNEGSYEIEMIGGVAENEANKQSGVRVDLLAGANTFNLECNFNIKEFTIRYRKGLAL